MSYPAYFLVSAYTEIALFSTKLTKQSKNAINRIAEFSKIS